jgi:hypothetical protein
VTVPLVAMEDPKKRKRNEDSDEEEDGPLLDAPDPDVPKLEKPALKVKTSRECPYLSTVNRDVLDFDFERLCRYITFLELNILLTFL